MIAQSDLVVIKLGSSVLTNPTNAPIIVQDIYEVSRRWYRVIVFVSALGHTTDQLVARSQLLCGHLPCGDDDVNGIADLLATGEITSVSYLNMLLCQAGLPIATLDYSFLKTVGSPLDAQPVDIDMACFDKAFEQSPIVVVPGFVGVDQTTGRTTLLGRGGSDLSALFCAYIMKAKSCQLLKDVNGVYDKDPKQISGSDLETHRFETINFTDAAQFSGKVIQKKALSFAAFRQQKFLVRPLGQSEILGCRGTTCTLVGEELSIKVGLQSARQTGPSDVTIIITGEDSRVLAASRWIKATHCNWRVILKNQVDALSIKKSTCLLLNLWKNRVKALAWMRAAIAQGTTMVVTDIKHYYQYHKLLGDELLSSKQKGQCYLSLAESGLKLSSDILKRRRQIRPTSCYELSFLTHQKGPLFVYDSDSELNHQIKRIEGLPLPTELSAKIPESLWRYPQFFRLLSTFVHVAELKDKLNLLHFSANRSDSLPAFLLQQDNELSVCCDIWIKFSLEAVWSDGHWQVSFLIQTADKGKRNSKSMDIKCKLSNTQTMYFQPDIANVLNPILLAGDLRHCVSCAHQRPTGTPVSDKLRNTEPLLAKVL